MQVGAASLRILDQARDVYDKARHDPAIVRNAGVALKLSILPTSI